MSGIWILSLMIMGMISSGVGLVSGGINFIDWARQFIFSSFLFLLIIPIVTTILLMTGKESRYLRVIQLISWGMAIGFVLLVGFSTSWNHRWELWGIWLFLGSAVSILILELLSIKKTKKEMV